MSPGVFEPAKGRKEAMMKRLLMTCALALTCCGALQADQLHLYGTEHMDVTTASYESVGLYEFSSVAILSGGDVQSLYTFENSSAVISGGSVDWIYGWGSSKITFSSGIADLISADNASSVEISGGSLNRLSATGISNTVLRGYDFHLGSGLSWAADSEEILGTGLLTGKWLGETEPWTINIIWNEPTAPIRALPEPASLVLLAFGGLLISRRAGV